MISVKKGDVSVAGIRDVAALNHEDVFAGAFTFHELENAAPVKKFLTVFDFVGVKNFNVAYRSYVVRDQFMLMDSFSVFYPEFIGPCLGQRNIFQKVSQLQRWPFGV